MTTVLKGVEGGGGDITFMISDLTSYSQTDAVEFLCLFEYTVPTIIVFIFFFNIVWSSSIFQYCKYQELFAHIINLALCWKVC